MLELIVLTGRALALVCHGVLSQNSIEPSRDSMIVAEEPAHARATMDVTVCTRWSETFRRKGINAKGRAINDVEVFDNGKYSHHTRSSTKARSGFSKSRVQQINEH